MFEKPAREDIWSPAPENLLLSRDEIHVWRAELDTDSSTRERLQKTLSGDERERAERFHFQRHREHFITARGVLRAILAMYLGIGPDEVKFSYNSHGKPSLSREHNSKTGFNLSHSHGLALYAVASGADVGVDLELIRRRTAKGGMAKRFFSPEETGRIRALPREEQAAAFFSCWTRKEAYLKAKGEGLTLRLNEFTVPVSPAETGAQVGVIKDPEKRSSWTLWHLVPRDGYVGALAARGKGKICLFHYR